MDQSYFPILISLIRGLYKILEKDLEKSANSVDLTLTELNFLWTIYYEEEATVSRIAALTLLDGSTVTQVIGRLKNKNLVISCKKKDDARYSYIKLTNEGNEKRRLSMHSDNKLITFLMKELEDSRGKQEIEKTMECLRKINSHFHGEEYVDWVYSLPKKFKMKMNEKENKNNK